MRLAKARMLCMVCRLAMKFIHMSASSLPGSLPPVCLACDKSMLFCLLACWYTGNLGLLGPVHIDPSTTTKILPVVGEHPAKTAMNTGSSKPPRPHTLHIQLEVRISASHQVQGELFACQSPFY